MRPAISGSSLATRHAMPLMIAAFCLLWSSSISAGLSALIISANPVLTVVLVVG